MRRLVAVGEVFLLGALISAQRPPAIPPQTLVNQYRDHVAFLRVPISGKDLHFDANGHLVRGERRGTWASDSTIHIRDVEVRKDEVLFRGVRRLFTYDSKEKAFVGRDGKSVNLRFDYSTSDPESLGNAFTAVFFKDPAEFENSVPAACRPLIQATHPKAGECGGDGVCIVGGDVLPPKALSAPDPSYTEAARRDHVSGTGTFAVVIDKAGKPRDICLVQSLRDDLDASSEEAIRGWRFKPGTRNGEPVLIRINVEVNFRLY